MSYVTKQQLKKVIVELLKQEIIQEIIMSGAPYPKTVLKQKLKTAFEAAIDAATALYGDEPPFI